MDLSRRAFLKATGIASIGAALATRAIVLTHALMHSCIRIQYDGKEIQIDPVSKLGNRSINYAAMPKADYIFVTHEHADHYDAAALKTLSADKTQLVMIVPKEFGKICLNIMRLSLAPNVRAAKTYSWFLNR